jgi:hypothetical protein
VLVYHNLLLDVINARRDLPQSGRFKIDFNKKEIVPVFGLWPTKMLPSVRYAISLLYGISGTFLFFVALGLNIVSTIKGVSPSYVIYLIWVWWAAAFFAVLFMMTTTARDRTS